MLLPHSLSFTHRQNFMKCLMKMFADDDKGVIFYETVLTLKKQLHTVIECVPLPWDIYDLIPQYFKESILSSEQEWSQHKKLIDFAARPGGFRRAMVPDLPYFMVQFDHKGEKGYGHVIEGTADVMESEEGYDEGEKGGGEFPLCVLSLHFFPCVC
jgi:Protein similar to CwfJ C-terminus 2/Protein similar to CwfJ C-terminus 1